MDVKKWDLVETEYNMKMELGERYPWICNIIHWFSLQVAENRCLTICRPGSHLIIIKQLCYPCTLKTVKTGA